MRHEEERVRGPGGWGAGGLALVFCLLSLGLLHGFSPCYTSRIKSCTTQDEWADRTPLAVTLRSVPRRLWARPPSPPSATSPGRPRSTQKTHPLLEPGGGLGNLACAPAALASCAPFSSPGALGLAPCVWGPVALTSGNLVSLWTAANSQLSGKAVPDQPYPKPYAAGDPLRSLPPQPPSRLTPCAEFHVRSILGHENEPRAGTSSEHSPTTWKRAGCPYAH